jgi:hypothetical protein
LVGAMMDWLIDSSLGLFAYRRKFSRELCCLRSCFWEGLGRQLEVKGGSAPDDTAMRVVLWDIMISISFDNKEVETIMR